jgi:hypothetical protein
MQLDEPSKLARPAKLTKHCTVTKPSHFIWGKRVKYNNYLLSEIFYLYSVLPDL